MIITKMPSLKLPVEVYRDIQNLVLTFPIFNNSAVLKDIKTYLMTSIRLVRAVADRYLEDRKSRGGIDPDKIRRAADLLSDGDEVMRRGMIKQARRRRHCVYQEKIEIKKEEERESLDRMLSNIEMVEIDGLYREVVLLRRGALRSERKREQLRNDKIMERCMRREGVRREELKREREVRVWKGVRCCEEEIREFADEKGVEVENREVPRYGGVELDDEEKAVLSLPPKFAIECKVDPEDVMTEVRKSFIKLRWEERSKTENQEVNNRNETSEDFDDVMRAPYNKPANTVDYSMVRPTDMKSNKRVVIPQNNLGLARESKLQSIECDVMNVARHLGSKGGGKESDNRTLNLTLPQMNGLKKIRKRIADNEIVVYTSDKSGKFTVDTKENYIRAMSPHTADMVPMTEGGVKKIESESNALAKIWVEMVGLGAGTGKSERINGNVSNKMTTAAPLYGLRKDHKVVEEGREHPMRPVCGAVAGPNSVISDLVADFISNVNEAVRDTRQCASTEEMLNAIEQFNGRKISGDLALFSLDVTALYPSLHLEKVRRIVYELIVESELSFRNISMTVAKKLLWFVTTQEQREEAGVQHLTSNWIVTRGGRRPGLSGFFSEGDGTWSHHVGHMTENEEKRVLALAVSGVMAKVMSQHPVTCGGDMFKQREGGAIGLNLTGVVAKSTMIWVDRELVERLHQLNLDCWLNKTYVDDKTLVTQNVQPGTRYMGGVAAYNDEWSNDDRAESRDQITAEFVRQVASDILPGIKFTMDSPSMNSDNKLPVLDLKMWLERSESGNVKIRHTFFEKTMTSPYVIHKLSAMAWGVKRATIVNEVKRRMYNMDGGHSWAERVEVLNRFCVKLLTSGYSNMDIYSLIKSGVGAWEKMIERNKEGICPLYRSREYKESMRWRNKIMKKSNWSRSDSVMFIPLSSKLREVATESIAKSGERIKVVERGGVSLKCLLQKSDPFSEPNCSDNGCPVCRVTVGGQKNCQKGGCTTSNVGYVVTCLDCQEGGKEARYEGESSRAFRIRVAEHLRDVRLKNENSGIYRHARDQHAGECPNLRFQVRKCFRDPLTRQVNEGVRISLADDDNLMNTKQEWVPPVVNRVLVV